MPLPLPTLDTRRWADLVDEGRAVIPRYAPEWTDHNVHDPGITLLELFAWLTEQLIYRANRVPERHLRKFLALAGFVPEPPLPARAVIAVQPAGGTGSLTIPQGTPFTTAAEDGRVIWFRTTEPLTAVDSQLVAVQTWDGTRFIDRSLGLRDRANIPLLGLDPRTPVPYDPDRAPACYFGFDRTLPVATRVTLWFQFAGAMRDERERIEREAVDSALGCARPPKKCRGADAEPDARHGRWGCVAPPPLGADGLGVSHVHWVAAARRGCRRDRRPNPRAHAQWARVPSSPDDDGAATDRCSRLAAVLDPLSPRPRCVRRDANAGGRDLQRRAGRTGASGLAAADDRGGSRGVGDYHGRPTGSDHRTHRRPRCRANDSRSSRRRPRLPSCWCSTTLHPPPRRQDRSRCRSSR